ncbi:NUDIX domain-containing protein [Halosimplex sp. J119]
MSETIGVAQLVVRAKRGSDCRYLLARRTMDGHWEFVGGKREPGESIREAARRELDEELQSVSPDAARITDIGESYHSHVDEQFLLTPVLVDLPGRTISSLDESDLSDEHDAMAWIELDEFDEYSTLGQREAVETLGL